jgi:hypothetical protein
VARSSSTTLAVELKLDSEPIRGWIDHPDGNREALWSSLELMQTIEPAAAHDTRATMQEGDDRHIDTTGTKSEARCEEADRRRRS